jgi:hypothetical protein
MVDANEIGMGFRPFCTSNALTWLYTRQVGHSFRDAKGQGRRKSSKVLQDFNDKVGSSHDAQVAALSEENRGAVALTVFKMGYTNSLTNTNTPNTPTPMFQRGALLGATPLSDSGRDEYSVGKLQVGAAEKVTHFKRSETDFSPSTENNVTTKRDEQSGNVFNKGVGCTLFPKAITKENDELACRIKNANDPSVDRPVAVDADEDVNEDVNAASSLLFLQRALGARLIETDGVKSGTNNSAILPANDTTHTANPFRHSWAVAVPSESGGTKNYYFI